MNKRDVAQPINYISDGYADGYLVYDGAECPNCGYGYEENDSAWKEPYCPHCGQRLNWEFKRKATEKQLAYIKHIERASCVPFYGETIEEADEYIKSHKRYLEKKRPDPGILTDIYDDIEQIYDPGMFC